MSLTLHALLSHEPEAEICEKFLQYQESIKQSDFRIHEDTILFFNTRA